MSKATFDHIYAAPDPRPYFLTLGALDYQIPAHGAAVFEPIVRHLDEARVDGPVRVADLCCSYGINAALLKHDRSFDEIVDHYTTTECIDMERDDLIQRDLEFFEAPRPPLDVEVVGLDVSAPAIGYGIEAGFLDAGRAEDLEDGPPSPELADMLRSVDLVTVTGGIGYITERTIGQVLDASEQKPWLAALCLRWVDFEPIADAAAERGMEVHKLDDVSFPQRRFADDAERTFVTQELERKGLSIEGHEEDGYHRAELFVAHPVDDPHALSLDDLVAPALADVGAA